MEIDQVYSFLMVANFRSFSRAAEETFISQSSLSKRVRMLESELGAELFVRNCHPVELTPAGKYLYQYASRLITDRDLLLSEMQNFLLLKEKTIRVGVTPGFSRFQFLDHISDFRLNNPGINLCLDEMWASAVLDGVEKGSLDFAILKLEGISLSNFDYIPLVQDNFVLAVSERNPLSKKAEASIDDIKRSNFIMFNRGPSMYINAFYQEILEKFDFSIPPFATCICIHQGMLLRMVELDFGVAIIPKYLLDRENYFGVVAIPLESTISDVVNTNCTISIIKKTDRRASADANRFYESFHKIQIKK